MSDLTVVMAIKDDLDDLPRTIDSVTKQEGVDLRLLPVDAGSTDGSVETIRRVAESDPRCEVLEIKAENEAAVWNATLPLIRTKYVRFANACSELPAGSCKRLVAKAVTHDADVLAFPTFHKSWGGGPWSEFQTLPMPLSEERKVEWFRKVCGCYSPPIARMYETSFLRSRPILKFVEDNAFEGCIHNWYATILARRFVLAEGEVFEQEKASKLCPWKIMGWRHHGDILPAAYRVEGFLRSDPARHRFLPTFLKVADYSVGNHLRAFADGMKSIAVK